MDQGHYRIFHFVVIKISRLIKIMFLFISLPEASSPLDSSDMTSP